MVQRGDADGRRIDSAGGPPPSAIRLADQFRPGSLPASDRPNNSLKLACENDDCNGRPVKPTGLTG